ncbi:ABC transporter permease subunit [Rubrobacter tropicus]|uniref:ABC transporter permease subunit n=1 Tax=Rubrobacter tropicus TaxID=2653851 RepID=A0A6G8QAG1_9ACTN|nr:carbohydrate ABC transporter permease [Rubrobacter tropicus]QIN83461.1 ABC transporter permease subunit [Rubrobacter tropicus]
MALDTPSAPERSEATGKPLQDRVMGWIAFAVLTLAAIVWLIPLLWALDTALKTEADTTTVPVTWIPPSGFTLESFWQILSAGNMLRWYFNSFLTSSIITLLVVLLGSLAAFGFSRVAFRGRRLLFLVIIAGLIIPPQILIVPLFAEMDALGFVDTYWGIILPQIAAPLSVFIFKQFFDGIPHELEDAARVDGASRFRIYWQIWMPLARPAIAAVAIFTFVISWNNFLWPFIIVTNTDMMTIPVGIATVQSSYGVRYADIMASAVLAGLPLIIVFLFFQRQIVQGVAGTGLKG